jgi:glycolate oxidase iron-sulfur subunit
MQWSELEKEVIRCIKCGACQSVCPVFRELRAESTVARGKINLIKAVIRGEVDAGGAAFAERMSWCLMCKACQESCPSGVRLDQLMLAARRKLVEDKGLPLLKKLIFRLGLRNRRVFDLGMSLGAVFQGLLLRPAPGGGGMLPRLPMGLDKRRLVSPVDAKPFRSRVPAVVAVDKPRRTVAFFTGCMINYVYPRIGEAVVDVLTRNGIAVVIPANQHCCGTPVYVNGDVATAVELARATVDTFADLEVDAVITACGSCGAALRKEYGALLADEPGYGDKAARLAAKTKDFAEFLAEVGLTAAPKGLAGRATYHDSCHLARGQGVRRQPRELIAGVPGLEFRELQAPARCCGAAGSFSLSHYELSRQINDHKVDDIAASGADMVATGCPMCLMHIADGLNQRGVGCETLHTAELLARAYGDET